LSQKRLEEEMLAYATFSPPAGWKETFLSLLSQPALSAAENCFKSFDFATSSQNQTKKIEISMLPQAKNACCGASNHATV